MAIDLDAALEELASLKEQVARLTREHDDLPWDAFEARFQNREQCRLLEERIAELHKQAAAL